MSAHPLPLRVEPAPDPVDPALAPLLDEPFAQAWAGEAAPGASPPPGAAALRGRLLQRLAASQALSTGKVTARWKRLEAVEPAPGVRVRALYDAPTDRPLRPGEPTRARLIELLPGARWAVPAGTDPVQWLVLRGAANVAGHGLAERDFLALPPTAAAQALHSERGALLFRREAALPPGALPAALAVRDAEAGWPEFAPGIRRRVLWQHAGQAAMLYAAEPGASVPLHTHGHDEECLMLQGDIFLDDVLLQTGDYQIAPAGSAHHTTQTDTGMVLFAHGDLELQLVG